MGAAVRAVQHPTEFGGSSAGGTQARRQAAQAGAGAPSEQSPRGVSSSTRVEGRGAPRGLQVELGRLGTPVGGRPRPPLAITCCPSRHAASVCGRAPSARSARRQDRTAGPGDSRCCRAHPNESAPCGAGAPTGPTSPGAGGGRIRPGCPRPAHARLRCPWLSSRRFGRRLALNE